MCVLFLFSFDLSYLFNAVVVVFASATVEPFEKVSKINSSNKTKRRKK